MMQNFELERLRFDPSEVAVFVGFIALFVLLLPSILNYFFFRTRVRLSVIERHQRNLRAASSRRGRVLQAARQIGTPASSLTSISAIFPSHIIKEKKRLLRAAGLSASWSLPLFFAVKGISFCFFGSAFILFAFLEVQESFRLSTIAILVGFSLFVWVSSDCFVFWLTSRRKKRLELGLPDCLDLLVICAEAGLSLDASLKRVAEEFFEAVPELSEELFLTSVELNFLPDRRQALVNLATRVDIPAFRGVTTALIQTEKYGTPLAQALRTLSSECREARLLAAEEKAARLPAILTVPMICFILPALFIVLAGPAVIDVLRAFS